MTYLMSCGCELETADLVRFYNRKVCPDHKGLIVGRKGVCDCGKVFYRGLKGQLGYLCDECAAKNSNLTTEQYKKQVTEKRKKFKEEQKLLEPGVKIKKIEKNLFTEPINCFSVSDAKRKRVDCIPCNNLFRFNRDFSKMMEDSHGI